MAKGKSKKSTHKKQVKKAAPIKKVKKAVASKKKSKNPAPTKAAAKAKRLQKSTSPAQTKRTAQLSADWGTILSPLDDRVLVSVVEAPEQKTASGLILIGDSSGEEQVRGKVEAVGRGHLSKKGKIRPLDLKKGDRVLFPRYAGAKVTVANQDMIILRESEVLGVIDGE